MCLAEPSLLRLSAFGATPKRFPWIHWQTRRLVLNQLPYAVSFLEQGPEVLMIALHGRQKRQRWQRPS